MTDNHLAELLTQRERIDAQIAELKAKKFESVVQSIVVEADRAGFDLTEISAALRAEHKRRLSAKRGNRVAPKYRHLPTGKTWAGRGSRPAWFVNDYDNVEVIA